MTAVYEIPTNSFNQTFDITLAGIGYALRLVWNDFSQTWVLNISDQSGNSIINGIPLVTGADLLEQYAYLGIGGKLIAQTDADLQAPPTYENLGSAGHLYFVTS